jgi:hypothetical protein
VLNRRLALCRIRAYEVPMNIIHVAISACSINGIYAMFCVYFAFGMLM